MKANGHAPALFTLAFAAATLAGCSDSQHTISSGQVTAPGRASTAPAPSSRGPRTIDDELDDLVDRAPGFGGMFFNADGSVTAASAIPGYDVELAAAVEDLLAAHRLGGSHRIVITPARYDYRQLHNWHLQISRQPQAGITRIGIDPRDNKVHVGVLNTASRDLVRQRIAALGIPDSAIFLSIEAPQLMLKASAARANPPPRQAPWC